MSTGQFDPATCTLQTCSITEYGFYDYLPSVAGNALYLALFGIMLIAQVWLGIRHRTWGYFIGMTCGLILEIIGYAGRIMLHDNIFSLSWFVMNICCLTLGPAFFSASIYVCLSRIIHIFGESLSPLRPSVITLSFVSCDIVAIALQAAGGAISSSANSQSDADLGVNIMIAGLSFQVATTVAFCAYLTTLFIKIRNSPHLINQDTATLRRTGAFRLFLTTITIAIVSILIRCCYRLAELSKGYDSPIANNEVEFMILEGAVMIICALALTIGHPGPILKEHWRTGAFNFKNLKQNRSEKTRPDMGARDHSASSHASDKTLAANDTLPFEKTVEQTHV